MIETMQMIQKIMALLSSKSMLKNHNLIKPDELQLLCTNIEEREQLMFPRYFDAVLIRPEHFGVNNWNFEVTKGWNTLFDQTVQEDFYHIVYGLFVFQDLPFLSASRWQFAGKMYSVEDAEVYYEMKLPYFVPFSRRYIMSSEDGMKFDGYFKASGVIRILPIGVTIAKRHRLLDMDEPVNKAVSTSQKINVEEEKQAIPARVKAFIEGLQK